MTNRREFRYRQRPDDADADPSAYEAEVNAFQKQVRQELKAARARFPDPDALLAALVEEVGELSAALLEEPEARVNAEAVQVAALATRLSIEGDPTLDAVRDARVTRPRAPRSTPTAEDVERAKR